MLIYYRQNTGRDALDPSLYSPSLICQIDFAMLPEGRVDLVNCPRTSTFLLTFSLMATLDIDTTTAALISQLALDDIADIRNASKGKAREGDPPSDAECALRAYAEEVDDMQRFFHDLKLARSIDNALELDQPVLSVLSVVEDGLRDDHVYAQALENGQALPLQSEPQRLLEDPDFLRLGSDDVKDTVGHGDGAPVNELVRVIHETPTRTQCVICRDDFLAHTLFMAPCNHSYCRQCLSNLATSCIGDESLFPLQCCRQNLPMDGPRGVFAQLDFRLKMSLRKKAAEFGTLFKDRLYCPKPTCSRFLGSIADHLDNTVCPHCATQVCVACKGRPRILTRAAGKTWLLNR
ncbi:RBR-type E3 ubiquitin transferase [Mycena sanguinolenta]|uniref:RBR-type E3 ubiquitin transferase n=1 Tax=Mycena sanguinolenta TaxID=230812 RepID=A0A8H7CH90_9AGAR|nr:RBR-type E3 ubiquitin transferase [Mycena sanguinolenta]